MKSASFSFDKRAPPNSTTTHVLGTGRRPRHFSFLFSVNFQITMPQKVVVVGAGPVGSLAALYAAVRGHNVEIYELRPGKLLPKQCRKTTYLIRIRSSGPQYNASQFFQVHQSSSIRARHQFSSSDWTSGARGCCARRNVSYAWAHDPHTQEWRIHPPATDL